ncbi:MAG: hypothetical protein Q8R02_16695 [Hyphomonadaceae bacterium]|nr:hypothetical protein [Hyphomonadaceae bacterium]
MKLAITEVTNMRESRRCVGAWNVDTGRMVRPLPNGENWTKALIDKFSIAAGTIIECEAKGRHVSSYPHKTEDTPIDASSVKYLKHKFTEWSGANAPTSRARVSTAFLNNVVFGSEFSGFKKAYVPEGTKCSSLVGLRLDRINLAFYDGKYDGKSKLRARVTDAEAQYDFSVGCTELQAEWRRGGFDRLTKILPKKGILHCRLGLVRAFAQQADKCYIQLNGIRF